MSKWILAAGAAALALTTPALAGPDKGQGGGKGGAKAERGGGGPMRAEGGGGPKADRGDRGQNIERQVARADRGNGGSQKAERQVARVERGERKALKVESRGNDRAFDVRKADKRETRVFRSDDRRDIRVRDDDRRFADADFDRRLSVFRDGCPPGLAKKDNGCMPPARPRNWSARCCLPRSARACSMGRTVNGIATTTDISIATTVTTSIASIAREG